MISTYNKKHVDDVLLVTVADDQGAESQVKRVDDVARVSLVEAPETVVAWNIFNASTLLGDINGTGQVTLTDGQIEKINTAIKDTGFPETLEEDDAPKTVVGFVKSCKKYLDSDHLSIAQTEVDNGEILQIVCDTPNIRAGQKVTVAKPGAVVPDSLTIWLGVLYDEESLGVICSAKGLRLLNAPVKKGILELPLDAEVSSAFAVGE